MVLYALDPITKRVVALANVAVLTLINPSTS